MKKTHYQFKLYCWYEFLGSCSIATEENENPSKIPKNPDTDKNWTSHQEFGIILGFKFNFRSWNV